MINYRITTEKGLTQIPKADRRSWVDVIDPSREELSLLERDYGINPEHLLDIMDTDEQARIEKEDAYTLVIVRLPVHEPKSEIPYYTLPCGILLFSDRIVTVCLRNCEVLDEMRTGKARSLDVANKSAFILHLFGRRPSSTCATSRTSTAAPLPSSTTSSARSRTTSSPSFSPSKSPSSFSRRASSRTRSSSRSSSPASPSASRRTRPSSSRMSSRITSRPLRCPTSTRTSSRA